MGKAVLRYIRQVGPRIHSVYIGSIYLNELGGFALVKSKPAK